MNPANMILTPAQPTAIKTTPGTSRRRFDETFTGAARVAAHERVIRQADVTKKAWPRTGRELRTGQPVSTLPALAKRTHADRIVMGTHGDTGLERARLGSVAERVVRHSPCPVLAVRELNRK